MLLSRRAAAAQSFSHDGCVFILFLHFDSFRHFHAKRFHYRRFPPSRCSIAFLFTNRYFASYFTHFHDFHSFHPFRSFRDSSIIVNTDFHFHFSADSWLRYWLRSASSSAFLLLLLSPLITAISRWFSRQIFFQALRGAAAMPLSIRFRRFRFQAFFFARYAFAAFYASRCFSHAAAFSFRFRCLSPAIDTFSWYIPPYHFISASRRQRNELRRRPRRQSAYERGNVARATVRFRNGFQKIRDERMPHSRFCHSRWCFLPDTRMSQPSEPKEPQNTFPRE